MFSVTFVCTGNRCRSPLGEAALRAVAPEWVEVASCGTLELDGAGPPGATLRAAGALGLDLSAHRARHLSDAALAGVDLVLGFEHDHVAAAVVEGGAHRERSFTLPQLARILRTHPPDTDLGISGGAEEKARARVAAAAAVTGGFVAGEEIDDPIGAPQPVHDATSSRIQGLCAEIADLLFG